MFESSEFISKEKNEVKKSNDYVVKVNDKNVDVYTCRISKYPLNTGWPGHQRDISQSEEVSFVNIVSDEVLHFEITATKSFEKVYLKPYSKKVKVERNDNKLLFDIKENGFYVLELDDYHGLLYIFNSKYVPCENKNDVTYYFDKGVYDVGTLTLKSNESVYVDKDAYVYGSIYAEYSENIKIYGNGIFDQSNQERTDPSCIYNGNLKFIKCRNVYINGVGFTNSRTWCVSIFNCFDVLLENVKIFGEWKYNTDGVDIVNSQDITVKKCFVHSFDDTIVIKAYDESIFVEGIGDCHTDNKNILVESCTLICDWGRCLELGYETACKEYANIVFRDIDILHSQASALSVHNGDYAEIHDVLFENIRVELNRFDTLCQMQTSEDMQYQNQNIIAPPYILCINNTRFREEYGHPIPFSPISEELPVIAYNHDIKVKDIFVYYDEQISKVNGKYNAIICINEAIEDNHFNNLVLENFVINGEKITEETVLYSYDTNGKIEIR